MKNALSIDVEDWYQGILQISPKDWPGYEERLSHNLRNILNILSSRGIKATFFILGYVAEKNPALVEAIAKDGHEIASHGYAHRPVYELSPQEFREDVARSKKILESISGTDIKGFRAPFFSITKKSLWALDILHDLGFMYDSSIFPTKNFLYGIADAPRVIYKAGKTGITEFPLSVLKIFGAALPVCGGFYLRALPYFITKYGMVHFNKKGHPLIVYMHPWELDINKPRVPMAFKWKLIHEYGISGMENKFRHLIKTFEFTTIREVLFGTQG